MLEFSKCGMKPLCSTLRYAHWGKVTRRVTGPRAPAIPRPTKPQQGLRKPAPHKPTTHPRHPCISCHTVQIALQETIMSIFVEILLNCILFLNYPRKQKKCMLVFSNEGELVFLFFWTFYIIFKIRGIIIKHDRCRINHLPLLPS